MTPGKSVNVCFICRELGAVILTRLGGRVNIVRIHSHVLPPTQQHMKLEQYVINYQKNIQKCAPKRDSLVYRRLPFCARVFCIHVYVCFPLSHYSRKHFYHAWTGLMIHQDIIKPIKK